MTKDVPNSLNWRELNEQLRDLTEDQLSALLDAEIKVGKRMSLLIRIHQRLTTLRMRRERREMLALMLQRPSQ